MPEIDTSRENVERVAAIWAALADTPTARSTGRAATYATTDALLRALVTERDTLLATDAARQKDHEEAEGDCREALSRLRELLSGALDEARAERDEARAEVERMRAALQPLAAFAAHHPATRQYGNRATSGEVWRMSSHGLPDAVLTVEDFHVAAALSAPAAKGGEDE